VILNWALLLFTTKTPTAAIAHLTKCEFDKPLPALN